MDKIKLKLTQMAAGLRRKIRIKDGAMLDASVLSGRHSLDQLDSYLVYSFPLRRETCMHSTETKKTDKNINEKRNAKQNTLSNRGNKFWEDYVTNYISSVTGDTGSSAASSNSSSTSTSSPESSRISRRWTQTISMEPEIAALRDNRRKTSQRRAPIPKRARMSSLDGSQDPSAPRTSGSTSMLGDRYFSTFRQ